MPHRRPGDRCPGAPAARVRLPDGRARLAGLAALIRKAGERKGAGSGEAEDEDEGKGRDAVRTWPKDDTGPVARWVAVAGSGHENRTAR